MEVPLDPEVVPLEVVPPDLEEEVPLGTTRDHPRTWAAGLPLVDPQEIRDRR